jgi:hypothetical protein
VIKRQDWHLGNGDFNYGGQICFVIDVHNPSGRIFREVGMVADGDDGGAFVFIREYPSVANCTSDFFGA